MHHTNALIIFSSSSYLDRTNTEDPLAALPWDDLDALYTALLGDTVRNGSQLFDVDLLVYRNEKEISDDFFLPFRQRIQLFSLGDEPFARQIQHALAQAFQQNYQRVVLLLENNPLISEEMLSRAFALLTYDDDCFVVGPTYEGRYYLIGMKMDHSRVFESAEGDPLKKQDLLMKQLCAIEAMVFLLNPLHSLDSGQNLIQLKRSIEGNVNGGGEYTNKTSAIFKMLEKKYRFKKILL